MGKIISYLLFTAATIMLVLPAEAYYSQDANEIFGDKNETEVIILLKEGSGFEDRDSDETDFGSQKKIMGYARESILKELELDIDSGNNFELTNAYSSFNGIAGKLKKSQYEKLAKNDEVMGIVKSGTKRIFLSESAPQINALPVWNTIVGNTPVKGKGETVCVADTGIDYTHPSLGGCTKESFLSGSCNKVLAGFDFVNNDNDPMDDLGHGTHVGGIIASTDNVFRGVAPDSSLTAVKVCDFFGGCEDNDILAGMDWCINNAEKYNISVISMSLGSFSVYKEYCDDKPESAAYKIAIDKAVAENVSVVVASGNFFSTDSISLPACIKNATAVGSVTKSDRISEFSNRNAITDLLAPGGEDSGSSQCPADKHICSAQLGGGFIGFSGTSMATPHVSAAFALMHQFKKLQENIELTPSQIENVLNGTGTRIFDAESNLFFSRINLYSALLKLNQTKFGPAEKPVGGLKIADVDAKIDGKASSLGSNGEIRKSAKPQSKIELEINLKNNFSQSSNVEIEDIKLKATIEDIDEGSDIEEESREFDLGPQEGKEIKIKFELPLNIEEGTYDILIEAEGEDKNDKEFKVTFKAEIEVEKEKHKLSFTRFVISPRVINCNRNVNINYELINLGQDDDIASLRVENEQLGLIFEQKGINILEDIAQNRFSKFINVGLKGANPGLFPIAAKLYSSNSKLQDTKTILLEIRECKEPEQKDGKEIMLFLGPDAIQAKLQSTATKMPIPSGNNSSWALAAGGIIAVVFLVSSIAAAMLRRLRP